MKQPLDFYDPGASDDELVTIPQGHLKDWHDYIEDLKGTMKCVENDLRHIIEEMGRDLANANRLAGRRPEVSMATANATAFSQPR